MIVGTGIFPQVYSRPDMPPSARNALFALLAIIAVPAYAISSIHISVGEVDAPAGQLKNARFQVDLKGAEPTLKLSAELKPGNEKTFTAFNLNCGTFLNTRIGELDCLNGVFAAKQINVPLTAHFKSYPGDFSVNIDFMQASFSDATGIHAGEKLTGKVILAARKQADVWHWSGVFNWTDGELYWQPFYFGKAGNSFAIGGTFKAPMLQIREANLLVNEVGSMSASAHINTQTKKVEDVKVVAKEVDFAGLYSLVLKPMVEKSAFGNLKVSGKADWQFEMKNLQPTSFELNLKNAHVEDLKGKFELNDINAHIPWDYDVPQTVELSYSQGHVLNMPLGNTRLQAELNRYSVTAPSLVLPVLDGALKFEDVSAAYLNQQWFWHLKMQLQPISMNQFSQTLGWPEMQGKVDGQVPLITYANKQLSMDGAMQFNMFNGSVRMYDLRIDDPLGTVPRLYANLEMRDIDLGDLTRTFNFGAIEGKLEGDVKDLRLESWKPVHMDAIIQTADGKHRKKVSQRAVENITALGGEGTAAALQRTFLRFFKEFNYEKIGLSCQLRQDVCKMGGVESTPTGYVIVKGKGVPTVTVNGYTEYVSLTDLLARIKRITDSNSKMIVK
ncbi:MAG TPA: hypothetical protein PKL53_06800 [Methylotenera sp.]|nr:hypothetical protein [Methylotenera sp.]HPV44160.1 hypothetical protein [Methylotenera sp.]